MAKFRVLAGKHIQNGPDGKERVYSAGDVVESHFNLVKALGGNKFEMISSDAETPISRGLLLREANTPQAPSKPPVKNEREFATLLEGMNAHELKKLAEEEEIDLKGATSKGDMIKIIKAAS